LLRSSRQRLRTELSAPNRTVAGLFPPLLTNKLHEQDSDQDIERFLDSSTYQRASRSIHSPSRYADIQKAGLSACPIALNLGYSKLLCPCQPDRDPPPPESSLLAYPCPILFTPPDISSKALRHQPTLRTQEKPI
jgi:hypothetical protein